MINVQREKQIFCGADYKEVAIYPATVKRALGRSPRKEVTSEKQANLNDKKARRYFIQLINTNFRDYRDWLLHLTYDDGRLPQTLEEAERIFKNFIRRLNYRLKKAGRKNAKYILVTSDTSSKTGEIVRIHHHVILSCDLSEREILEQWNFGRRNLNQLQGRDDKYNKLAEYLIKNARSKKRWISSKGLKKPQEQTNDKKYSRRQIEKIAKLPPDAGIWEKIYKGWTLINSESAYEVTYNEMTGWSIYLKLRKKKEECGGRFGTC